MKRAREGDSMFLGRGAFRAREMGPELVVISQVLLQNASQVRLVPRDQVAQTFPTNRADGPLREGCRHATFGEPRINSPG